MTPSKSAGIKNPMIFAAECATIAGNKLPDFSLKYPAIIPKPNAEPSMAVAMVLSVSNIKGKCMAEKSKAQKITG